MSLSTRRFQPLPRIAHLGPLFGQGGLDRPERGLGHVEDGTGAEALHVGASRAEVEQRAADRDPVHRDVGAERDPQGGVR